MKPTKRSIKLLEIASFCCYLAWLVFTLVVWGTDQMQKNKFTMVFLLLFAAVIYVLLCYIRKMPQIRMLPQGLTREQAMCIVRLRLKWVASIKLIFVCSFAGISISLLYSQIARLVFTVCAIAALCGVSIYFLLSTRGVLKKRLAVAECHETQTGNADRKAARTTCERVPPKPWRRV